MLRADPAGTPPGEKPWRTPRCYGGRACHGSQDLPGDSRALPGSPRGPGGPVSDRLFTPGPASDPWYSGLRDATDARTVEIREWCEALWARHQTYADTHFLVQI